MKMRSTSNITAKRGRPTTGRVTELTIGRFCGMIRTSDGQSVFFHGRDLEGGKYNEVEIGGLVKFELIDDQISGPRATRVRTTR